MESLVNVPPVAPLLLEAINVFDRVFGGSASKAADTTSSFHGSAEDAGVSGIWIVANISFAGMRAQNSASAGWRAPLPLYLASPARC